MAANISIVRDSFTLTTLSHLYNFKSRLFGMLTFGNKCLQLTCRFEKTKTKKTNKKRLHACLQAAAVKFWSPALYSYSERKNVEGAGGLTVS